MYFVNVFVFECVLYVMVWIVYGCKINLVFYLYYVVGVLKIVIG